MSVHRHYYGFNSSTAMGYCFESTSDLVTWLAVDPSTRRWVTRYELESILGVRLSSRRVRLMPVLMSDGVAGGYCQIYIF